jgi:hypothetical protein
MCFLKSKVKSQKQKVLYYIFVITLRNLKKRPYLSNPSAFFKSASAFITSSSALK